MATSTANRLTIQHRSYFDRLAPSWDDGHTPGELACLRDIVADLDIETGSSVLDIGSGTGVLVPFLLEAVGDRGKVIALDFSRGMLEQAKARGFGPWVDFLQADVAAIPLAEDLVDIAICSNTFPHFGDQAGTLREIAMVVRAGGRVVICHTMSRGAINQFHRSVGGVVGADLLPDEVRMGEMVRDASLAITRLEDCSRRYLLIARRLVQTPG
ncbi:MAG: methyltransferase domain-containing protein [Chloroflexota bacterium]|nr:methyltransferase domain-containing protein [Chloroflexota bacterium]